MKEYRQCTRCVMSDKSDPDIRFDAKGHCNYCNDALDKMPKVYFPNREGGEKLNRMLAEIKEAGKGKPFDCLMGISGGLDSAYLAYLGAAKWGLRIAAVHIDDGFDTETAIANTEKLVKKCGLEIVTIKPDKRQFNELTRAYMLAGVPSLANPQDNILFANLHVYAKENKIPNFLSGVNFALECILQPTKSHPFVDTVNMLDINEKFGRDKTDRLDIMSL